MTYLGPDQRIVIIDNVRVFVGFSEADFKSFIQQETLEAYRQRLARKKASLDFLRGKLM